MGQCHQLLMNWRRNVGMEMGMGNCLYERYLLLQHFNWIKSEINPWFGPGMSRTNYYKESCIDIYITNGEDKQFKKLFNNKSVKIFIIFSINSKHMDNQDVISLTIYINVFLYLVRYYWDIVLISVNLLSFRKTFAKLLMPSIFFLTYRL